MPFLHVEQFSQFIDFFGLDWEQTLVGQSFLFIFSLKYSALEDSITESPLPA